MDEHDGTAPVVTPASPGATAAEHAAMGLALDEARAALGTGDVPVGAVVLGPDGAVVGRGRNLREADADPVAHAEVVALRDAARTLGGWRLDGCTLVVTLEPCLMCAGATLLARVPRLVLGAWDPKAGACGSQWDVVRDRRSTHRVEVHGGVRAAESADLLHGFFAAHR
ncbi:tRNA(adenine34) deaminase [Cellulomonas oligotrophica]|uniref:tRNA-specific adenosine deaminase n=2 Tax=Cellulomonas oligotrophica TaxID=931536 RepID=A0A7Y9JYW7_9CELL|nr:tRNA(adenine34) deaminase [Cellulomonas oligotrophica]GIG34324.1 tRNA-specific adenosine deaminase [Cellulomonas oligotrophica]